MIRFFAQHPTAANLLMIFFLVIGAVSLPTLRRETFPDFSADKVQINVVYPGATAEDVEDAICRRIKDAVDGISYVKEVISESKEGSGSVTVEMQSGGDISTGDDIYFKKGDTFTDAILVIRKGKRPQELCINPECPGKKVKTDKEGKKCPKCGKGKLVLRKSVYGAFLGCDQYPKCRHIEKI